jgi:hypothetical protein
VCLPSRRSNASLAWDLYDSIIREGTPSFVNSPFPANPQVSSIALPENLGSLLPAGPQVWQVKSGSSPPDASREFDPKHTALIEAIRDGYNYVLFWTNDPVDPTATTIQDNFRASVQSIRQSATTTFLFADAIEHLCYAHIAVLAQGSTLPLNGVVSLSTWGKRQDFAIPFQADNQRDEYATAIRFHVRSEASASSALHLYGDTGVGKSRLVYEALAEDGIAERVLVALDPGDLDRSLLTMVAESADRRLILVVDECTAGDRQAVARYADLAEARVRMVTIGSRYSRDPQPIDARYLEVLPLATGASRDIALSVGLSETDAETVATYTEGYPKLAFVLAQAISSGGTTTNLLDRIRSEAVGSVLSSMLTDRDDITLLGGLAMFEKLGFEEDLAQETTIACQALEIDEAAFRRVVDRELLRFVSSAGRYRLVTPRLFAVWLATQFVQHQQKLAEALQRLPESLRDRMIQQMKAFAGDRNIGQALSQLLDQPPFTTGALDDVDEGSARLLHVAAIVDPLLAMDAIETVMGAHTTEALHARLREGRRGFINALEVLIWFEETFERAAWALLRLAVAENETWSNNATGILQGIFRIYLGGTSASYSERLAWTRLALRRRDPTVDSVLIHGLANAFLVHETRQTPDFASRNASPEWRPQGLPEEVAARSGVWDLLIELARDGRDVEAVASAMATGVRTLVRRGMAEHVLTDLSTISWPPSARVHLSDAIDSLMKYEQLPTDLRDRFQELRSTLIGSTQDDQLAYLLSQEPWKFYELGQQDDLSPLLTEMARRLVTDGQSAILYAARKSRAGDSRTASLLFERVAITSPIESLLTALESELPLPEGAVLGAFVGLGKTHGSLWTTEQLDRWLRDGPGYLVVPAVHMLPATSALAERAIQAVRDGYSNPRELGRFLYGAWGRDLPAENIVTIAELLSQTTDPGAIEQGLGIISQWLDEHPKHQEPDLDRTAIDLIDMAIKETGRHSSMIALYRQKILTRLNVPIEEQLRIMADVVSGLDSFLSDADLETIDSLARRDPTRTIEMLIAVILGDEYGGPTHGVMWLESSKILSRLATVTSAADVLSQIENVPKDGWRELIAHVSFAEALPDSLIESLIIKSTDDVVRGRAALYFMYPENGWIGQESDFLRGRRSVASSWLDHTDSPEMRQWVRKVIEDLDARIAEAERTEVEEDR